MIVAIVVQAAINVMVMNVIIEMVDVSASRRMVPLAPVASTVAQQEFISQGSPSVLSVDLDK